MFDAGVNTMFLTMGQTPTCYNRFLVSLYADDISVSYISCLDNRRGQLQGSLSSFTVLDRHEGLPS
jgi:hypothetical protein